MVSNWFGQADLDKDGRLNYEEYNAFTLLTQEEALKKYGGKYDFNDDEQKAIYGAYNGLSEGEGVTEDDLMKAKPIFKACGIAAKAAAVAAAGKEQQ